MSRPSNLLFDLGNVIIDLDIPRTRDRLISMLTDPDDFQPVLDTIIKYESGRIGTELFINQILARSHRGMQALDVIEAWNAMLLSIPPHRLEMLLALRINHGVFLLSNTNELHLTWVHRYLDQEHGVTDFESRFFDRAFYSHLMRDRKPNPSIYETVTRETGIEPADMLFMDDMPENLAPAQALGFQTYLVGEGEDVTEYLRASGYLE